MPLIDVTSSFVKGDDTACLGVFSPSVNRGEGFGVFLFRKLRNWMIKLSLCHILN
ncbi:MAG: hypothetical protein WA324_12065 [Bryobacteraceae bacterium]